jgi:hypothetical protein
VSYPPLPDAIAHDTINGKVVRQYFDADQMKAYFDLGVKEGQFERLIDEVVRESKMAEALKILGEYFRQIEDNAQQLGVEDVRTRAKHMADLVDRVLAETKTPTTPTTPTPPLEPVDGDLLPPIGSRVRIHLNSQDAWVEHTVVGYYVWGAKIQFHHRVFVRVVDDQGYLNARLLCDVRPVKAST